MLKFNFKNDNERRRFLQKYENWGVWFTEPRTNVTYYRCKLPSGHFVVMEKQPDKIKKCCYTTYPVKRERYHMYKDSYDLTEVRITEIMEALHALRGTFDIEIAEDLNRAGDRNE